MKKYDLLKILGITFGIVILLSWVIPAGIFSSGAYTALEATAPIGIYDIIRIPAITIATFIQYGLLLLTIGGLYGVLNKTGVYSDLINAIVKKWKGKEKKFLILIIVVMTLLSSLTGLMNLLFVIVPFLITILLLLGYNKITSFAATVGALLVGQMASTYGFGINGYLNVFFELGVHDEILTKIILLVIVTILLVALVVKNSKLEKTSKTTKKVASKKEEVKEEKIEIPLYEENSKKKSKVPFIFISLLTLILLFVGLYNWYYMFDVEFFTDLHESITTFTVGTYPLFGNLLGSVSEFGFFGNYDLITILVFASLLIGWIYNVKLNEIISGFANGAKKMLPTAFYAMIASVIFALLLNSANGNFVHNIINSLLTRSTEFSFPATMAASGIASFFYNDFYTLVNTFYGVFGSFGELSLTAFIIQAMNGLVMLIAPTSVFLIAGLKYLEIPYKEWFKYIWKFLLAAFGVIIVISLILAMFI